MRESRFKICLIICDEAPLILRGILCGWVVIPVTDCGRNEIIKLANPINKLLDPHVIWRSRFRIRERAKHCENRSVRAAKAPLSDLFDRR